MHRSAPVVLVIDDDAAICDLLRHLLEGECYAVEHALDGAAGLAAVDAGEVDLILLDLMLPTMDGFEVCRQVRKREAEAYLPIIMVTALDTAVQRHEGFAAGVDDYVTKPFDPEELVDRVGVWLRASGRIKQAHQQLLAQQERLRELEQRQLREELAQDEAVLLMMDAPLRILLNVLQAWEASHPSLSDATRVRADIDEAVNELSARINVLRELLRGESNAGSAPTDLAK